MVQVRLVWRLPFLDVPSNAAITGCTTQPDGSDYILLGDTLLCSAAGYPAVSYTWQWTDGQSVHTATGQALMVTELGVRNYTCTAVNGMGSDSTTVDIGVMSKLQTSRFISILSYRLTVYV